jgi:hypothetical protein
VNQNVFFTSLIEYSRGEGYSFFVPGEAFDEPRKLSAGGQALIAVAAGAFAGLLGGLSSGYLDKTSKEDLLVDMKNMSQYCDVVGLKLSYGNVLLRLGIDSDNLSNETLIGRFSMIHERVHDFRKYAASFLRSVFSDGKQPTFAHVFVIFSSHKRAKDFKDNCAEKCKQSAFWKKVYTSPWLVDLEDEELATFEKALVPRNLTEMKAALFRNRD